MSLVLDTGALLAADRGDRRLAALLKRELEAGRAPISHGGVVAQAWRGGARQARLARLLDAIDVVPLDLELGRRAGELLARTREVDAIDAAVVLLAHDDDAVLTSDPRDLEALAEAAGLHVEIVRV